MRFATSVAALLSATMTGSGMSSLSINPSTVTGGASTTATLTLSQPARGNATFGVQLSNGEYASAPATVTVPSGATAASFTIGTRAVDLLVHTVTVTVAGASATLIIMPGSPPSLVDFLFDVSKILRGSSFLGSIFLDGAAPNEGAIVTLSAKASNASVLSGITVPTSVKVPAGQKSVSFPIAVASNATPGTITVTATLGRVSVKKDIIIP